MNHREAKLNEDRVKAKEEAVRHRDQEVRKTVKHKHVLLKHYSDVRHYFENDPAKVINFISDPNNALEAHEMGLKHKVT